MARLRRVLQKIHTNSNDAHTICTSAKKGGEATRTLLLIALFKLLKGLLLIAVGVGAVKLLHRDVAETVEHWVGVLRVDPDNRLVHGLLTRVFRISPDQLKALSVGTFLYAGLLLTEGTGLLLRKGGRNISPSSPRRA